MKKKILVYNYLFFELSETFIYLQVKLMLKFFDISLIGYEIKNSNHFDTNGMKIRVIERIDQPFWRLIYKVARRLRLYFPFERVEKRMLECILKRNDFGLLHAHFGYNAVKILPLAKKFNIPLIVSFHGIDASKRIFDQPKYFKRLPQLLDYASKIVVASQHMTANLQITAVNRSKVVHIPYSVDTEYFGAPIRNGKSSGVLNILHSGRLVPKKGILDLIRVFKDLRLEFRDIRLHILGEGDDYQQAYEMVKANDMRERVVFYGSQPQDKVKELMQMSDIFVLNSRVADDGDMEGTPVSLLEAMSTGMAVVSTFHAGIPEVIQNEYNGLLVAERDNEQLLKAIRRLLVDQSLRMSLAANARKTVLEKFNLRTLESELLSIYNSVLAG